MKTKYILVAGLLSLASSVGVNAQSFDIDMTKVQPVYSAENGQGYDIVAAPKAKSDAPFFYSVKVADGNYKVTVVLGSKKKAGKTVVRAENRRLMLDEVSTSTRPERSPRRTAARSKCSSPSTPSQPRAGRRGGRHRR